MANVWEDARTAREALAAATEAAGASAWVAQDDRRRLRHAVRVAATYGIPEAAIARETGLSRTTVRKWLGG